MTAFIGKLLLLWLLILPTTIVLISNGDGTLYARAQDANDPMEGEDDEATVETDDGAPVSETDDDADRESAVTGKEEEEAEEEDLLKPSPDVETVILFTKPVLTTDFPTGKPVRFLVGFTNKGEKNFVVDNMEASFRYPQDYSFYIQNFTAVKLSQTVEPNRQASFEYGFQPNEAFSGRPFGLTINLNYRDVDGNVFQNAVFNETINVVEPDEGLDGETFFLYVFLAAVVVLLLVGAQQLVSTYGRKRLLKPKAPVEMGTQNTDVDYDWLPKETLQELNRSPRRSPKQSPRQRKNKRSTGSGEE